MTYAGWAAAAFLTLFFLGVLTVGQPAEADRQRTRADALQATLQPLRATVAAYPTPTPWSHVCGSYYPC